MFDCGPACLPLWQTNCEGLRMHCNDGGVCCAFSGGCCDGPCPSVGESEGTDPELPTWRPRPKRRPRHKSAESRRPPSPQPSTSEHEKLPGVGGVCEWPFGCPYSCAEPEPEKPKTPEDETHGWGTLLDKDPPELEPYNPPVPCGIGYPCGYRSRGKLYMPGGPGQVFPRVPCRPMPVCPPCQPSPCMPCMPCLPCPPCPTTCLPAGRRTRYTSLMAPAVPMSVSAIVALSLLAANHASGTCKCPVVDPCQAPPAPPPCPGVGPGCSTGFCPAGPIINSGNAFNPGPCTQNCGMGCGAPPEPPGPACLRPALSERRLAGGAEYPQDSDMNAGQPRASDLPTSPSGRAGCGSGRRHRSETGTGTGSGSGSGPGPGPAPAPGPGSGSGSGSGPGPGPASGSGSENGSRNGAETRSGTGAGSDGQPEVKKTKNIPGVYPYALDPPPGLYPPWLGCGPYAYNCFMDQPPLPTCVPGIMPPSGKKPPCFFPPRPKRCANAVPRDTAEQYSPDNKPDTEDKWCNTNDAKYPNSSMLSVKAINSKNFNKHGKPSLPKPINYSSHNSLNARKSKNGNHHDRSSRSRRRSLDPNDITDNAARPQRPKRHLKSGVGGSMDGAGGGADDGGSCCGCRGSRNRGPNNGNLMGANDLAGSFGGIDPKIQDEPLPDAPMRYPNKMPCGCTRRHGPCPPHCLQPKPVGSEEEERRRRERIRRRFAALHPKCTLPLVLPYQRKRGARTSVYPPAKGSKGDKDSKGQKDSDDSVPCPREKKSEVCLEPEPSPESPPPPPPACEDWCIPYITPYHGLPGSRSLSAPPEVAGGKWNAQGVCPMQSMQSIPCVPGMPRTPSGLLGAPGTPKMHAIQGIQGMPQRPQVPCAPNMPRGNMCYANMLQTMPLGPMGAMGPTGPMGPIPISPPAKARSSTGPPGRTSFGPPGRVPSGMIPAGVRPSATAVCRRSSILVGSGGVPSSIPRGSVPRFVGADDRPRRRDRQERQDYPERQERRERPERGERGERSERRRSHSRRRHGGAGADPCTGVCAPCPVLPDGCGPAAMRAAGYTNIPLDRGPCFPGPPLPPPPLPCGQQPTGPANEASVCTKNLEAGKEASCVEKKTMLCKITPVTRTLMCYERTQPICATDPTVCGGSESCLAKEPKPQSPQPEFKRTQIWPPPPCPALPKPLCLPPPINDGEPPLPRHRRPKDPGCVGRQRKDECATFSQCFTDSYSY